MMVIVQPRWWPVSLVPGQQGYKIPGWGTFMNTYAIWRSNYGPSENMPVQFPTTTLDYSFTRMLNIPVSGNYTFEYSADNNLNISIDDVKKITITASNAFTSSNISSIFLTAGTKVLNCSVYNDAFDTLPSIPWYTRTIGFALTIRNNSNQIIWDTRSAMQEEIVYVGEPYGLSGNMMTAIAGVIAASGNQMGPAYADIYTTPGAYTWTKRPRTRRVDVLLYGGGGGGGGGGNAKLDTYAVYGWWLSGGGGGRGGQVYYKSGINDSKLKSTGTVIVGAGGLGGSSSANLGTGTNGFAGSATLCSIFKDLSTITTDQAPGGQGGTWYADPWPGLTQIAGAKGGGNPLIDSGYGGDAANYNQIYFAQYQGTNGGSSANTWPMTTTSIIPEISYIGTATAVTNPNWNTFLNNYAVWDNAAGNASPYILHRFRGIFTGRYGTYKLTVGVANMPTVQGTYLNVYVDDDFIIQTSGTTVTNVLFLNNTTTITFEVFNVTSPWVTEALTTSTPNFNPPGFAAIITTTTNTVLWDTRSNRVQLRNNAITSYTVTNKIYQSSGGGSGGSVQIGIGGNPYLIDIPGRGSWSGEHTYVGANSTGYFPYVAYPYVSPTYSMVVRSIPNSVETNYVTNSANMVSGKSAIVTNITGTQRLIPGPVLPTVVGTTTTNILYACGGAGGSYNYYYPIQFQTPTGGAGGFPGGGGGGGAGGGSYGGWGGFAGGKGGDGLAIIISYT